MGWRRFSLAPEKLGYTNANLHLGSWNPGAGELWFDDAVLEETIFVNLVRRPGAPLRVTLNGRELAEGIHFEPLSDPNMGRHL